MLEGVGVNSFLKVNHTMALQFLRPLRKTTIVISKNTAIEKSEKLRVVEEDLSF